ncbi:MAG TPA: hypothetical protein VF219_22455 [Vicinamibacterales bacterium]
MLSSFGAGFLAAMIVGFRVGPSGECRVGDMESALHAQAGKALEQAFGAWIHRARVCHVGDYVVIAPVTADQSDIIVGRNGKTSFIALSRTQTEIVDEGRVLYDWDRTRKVITYAAYDGVRKSWVENYDVNADGSIEVRTIESGTGGKVREVPSSDRWLQLVSQDGRSGTILNQRFMSVDEARAQLSAAR